MKKIFAFLLAFSVCFLALGTYGFESPANCTDEACEEHRHSGLTLMAADSDYLIAEVANQNYNTATDTLSVTIAIDSFSGERVSGGTITVSTYGAVLRNPTLGFSYLFGTTIDDEAEITSASSGTSVTIRVPDLGTDSRSSTGSITIIYSVDESYLSMLSRDQTLNISGSAIKAEEENLSFNTASRALHVYICTHSNVVERIVKEATCTEAGSKETYCTICGYVVEREEILPIDHIYDYTDVRSYPGQNPAVQPTCTTSGSGSVKCIMCNEWHYESLIPALGHDWSDRYLDDGVYVERCRRCNAVRTADNQCSHDPDDYELMVVLEESTCTEHGSAIYGCPICDRTEIRELPLEHLFGSWTTVTTATCTTAGSRRHTCVICGEVETEVIPALGHDWGEWETITEATCVSAGTERRVCATCGAVDTESITGGGHSWGVWRTTQNATCTSEGTQTRTCSLCGQTETQPIAMTEHVYGVWTTTVAPTCQASGTQIHTCTGCGKTETRTVAADPSAHSWSEWNVVEAKTCITDGVKEHTCTLCGAVESSVDPCGGHTFGEAVVDGRVTTKTCSVCGYSEATRTVNDGVEKTLTSTGGSLFVTGSTASGSLDFEIGVMPVERFEHYKDLISQYSGVEVSSGYDFKLLSGGNKISIVSGMELTLKLDASLEDYDVDFVIVNDAGAVSMLGDYDRKGLNVTIDGADLTGAERIFVVKGEENTPNIVVPIIIAVCTLAIAGAAVYFIMSKNKKKSDTF